MFSGLSAFPLTPMSEDGIDEASFSTLMKRLVEARVDSIGVLGSTGSYAYLTRAERLRITQLAVEQAQDIPVMVGIGALRTSHVLALADDAQQAGAAAVLLAPVSYQALTDEEVFNLYETVTRNLSIPLCVYDNPTTTHFNFSDELHGRIARLPQVRSIKLPSTNVPADLEAARTRIDRLRALIPEHVTLGISGDASAATGLNAGCDLWYSVIGGLFPKTALAITRASQSGNLHEAARLSEQLQPLWTLFSQCGGSVRVIAAAAEMLSLTYSPCLPLPLQSIDGAKREQLARLLKEMELG